MNKYLFLIPIVLGWGCGNQGQKTQESTLPNIVVILADDLGYGDVSHLNPESKIPTPNIDRLAESGMTFTDAHSPCSVCTPTRYGILTGQYCWRTRLPRGVLRGYGPSLIEPERTTLAGLLKRKGYETGVVGKWHLGVDWVLKPGFTQEDAYLNPLPPGQGIPGTLNHQMLDLTKPVTDGPNDHGFDYSFILPASLDMQPYCYLENNAPVVAPTDSTPGNDLNTGYTEAFWRAGKMAPGFDFYRVLPTFIEKSKNFIRSASEKENPFFLYLPFAAPHTPWVPITKFAKSAGAGNYGDFVHQVDDGVGQIIETIEELGIEKNTLIIFTSDNGPFWTPELIEKYQHRSASIYRGMKADTWEGGHRVPFVVRWPGNIPAGKRTDALLSLVDVMATCANLVDEPIRAGEGEDSFDQTSVLRGGGGGRESLVMQSSRGHFAIRKGPWKYIPKLGSGGFSKPQTEEPQPGGPSGQLYLLSEDPAERNNLFSQFPDQVTELSALLETIKNAN